MSNIRVTLILSGDTQTSLLIELVATLPGGSIIGPLHTSPHNQI